MQPGSGQILGAVRGLGSEWDSGRVLGRPGPTFCLRVWAWVIGRPFALTPPTGLFSDPLRAHLLQGPGCGFGNGDEPGPAFKVVEKGPYPVRLQPRCDN